MKSTPEALKKAATQFVQLSGNSGGSLRTEGYNFVIEEGTNLLLVQERFIRPMATGNKLEHRTRTATDWFGELATLAGIDADIYDITYLKIAVKDQLKMTEGVTHG